MKAIRCHKVFDGEQVLENHAVLYDGNTIHSVVSHQDIPASCDVETYSSGLLVPGFIDLQVNGGGGELFNDTQSVDAIKQISFGHRQFGTTSFMPTLISDSAEKMQRSHESAAKAMADDSYGVLGVHFEGPFLNQAKRGAHSLDQVRAIQPEDVQFLLGDFPGIKLVTLAPECVNPTIIEALCTAGVKVCLGHSNATYEQTIDAIRAGASGFTHLYNAMSGFSARAPGVIGAALDSESTWCGLIVDGMHVHPASLKVALASKPQGKCFLVTDAMPTVGSDTNEFLFFGELLHARDGKIINRDGVLSGSHLNMATAVRNTVELLGQSIEEAIRMASLYPAEYLGVSDRLGKIKAGYQADLLLLNDELAVTQSWKNGQSVAAPSDHGPVCV